MRVKTTSPEWTFILESLKWLLQSPEDDRGPLPLPAAEEIGIPKLLQLSKRQRVFPHLAPIIQSCVQQSHSAWHIKNEILQHQQIALKRLALLVKLSNLFDAHGVPHLILKGPALSLVLYGDSSLRMMSDLDFLIPENQLPHASRLLTEIGFHYFHNFDFENNLKQILRFQKDIVLSHPQQPGLVELHGRLMDSIFLKSIDWRTAWAERQEVVLNAKIFNTLSAEQNLIYLCTHGHRHGWEKLHWLFDFANFYIRFFKGRDLAVQSLAKKYRVGHELKCALLLTHDFFNTPLPTFLNSTMLSDDVFQKMKLKVQKFQEANPDQEDTWSRDKLSYWAQAFAKGRLDFLLYPKKLKWNRLWIKDRRQDETTKVKSIHA